MSANFDPKKISMADWITFGTGVLALVFTFLPWFSVTSSGSVYGHHHEFSISTSAWGGWWTIVPLLLIVIVALRAVQVFTGSLVKEIPGIAMMGTAGAVLVLSLIVLIQAFTDSTSVSQPGVQVSGGPGFGLFGFIVLAIAFVYFLALGVQRTSKLPFKVPGPANF